MTAALDEVPRAQSVDPAIAVVGATTHNLKGVDCHFPHGRLSVVTGVSGSGKSSLAFETVYQEGQRRYLQTFSTYARQYLERMKRPPVEAIHYLQPTLALRQHHTVTQPRSTVGTVTELSDYLGLLFVAMGELGCVGCGEPVVADTPTSIGRTLADDLDGRRVTLVSPLEPDDPAEGAVEALIREGYARLYVAGEIWRMDERSIDEVLALDELPVVIDRLAVKGQTPRLRDSIERALELGRGRLQVWPEQADTPRRFYADLRCNACGRPHPPLTPGLFSFNTPLGACRGCGGFGRAMGLAVEMIVPDPRRSIAGGAIEPFQTERGRRHQLAVEQLCRRHDIPIDRPWHRLGDADVQCLFDGDAVYGGIRAFFKALEAERYKAESGMLLARYRRYTTCGACAGTRLSPEARAVRVRGHHVGELAGWPIGRLVEFFDTLEMTAAEQARAGIVAGEIIRRLHLLLDVGLTYLTPSRLTRTLSSGEYQRIQLAGCIGRGLVDTCYVLDEPTAGLHARDSARLLVVLHELRDLGNTVIVVEHDPVVIRGADHVVELGPGGGESGGELLYEGPVAGLVGAETPTGQALAASPDGRSTADPPAARAVTLVGATEHNLKDLTVQFPLGRFTAVTGVSGSGKSSLVFDVLRPAFEAQRRGEPIRQRLCLDLTGTHALGDVVAMHEVHSGLTARSTVMSYIGVLEPIRKLLAATPGARAHALSPLHFSTNVKGGRCDACEGMGVQLVDMHFVADVAVTCETCDGKRFKPAVLDVRVGGLNIDDVHRLSVERGLEHFAAHADVLVYLRALHDVGLGYVRLGQPTQTLSGGELQRMRIAQQLVNRSSEGDRRPTLFLFDEPSLGLHASDIRRLIDLFQRLRDDGHTVIAVEHNLDLIAAADWIVDLGPEAGPAGGELVVEGPPRVVAACEHSHTGRALRDARGQQTG